MQRSLIKKVLLSFFLLVINTAAQNKLNFNFDYADFVYDSTSNYLEIYYSFNLKNLTVQEEGNTKFVKAKLSIQLQNTDTDELVINKQWVLNKPIKDSNDVKKLSLGVLGFVVPAGSYKLKLVAVDSQNDDHSYNQTEDINIVPYLTDEMAISNIELAQNIKMNSKDSTSMFYKNSLEVIPNPAILYSNVAPVLFFYSELYNLKNYSKVPNLEFSQVVYNSLGESVYSKMKKIGTKYNSIVEVGAINLKKLPTDSYNISLILKDTLSKKEFISSKKFFLINPGVKNVERNTINSKGYLASEFSVYTDKECDLLFNESKYIASKKEIDGYKKLDSLSAKREFLYKFWKKRDPLPSTPRNEFKKEYLDRINYCNAHFSALNKKGYKTDRGRVYLMYGPPDQVDRYPNEINSKPYEIWQYNSIEGGVIFVFGDITGYADYELLHSTKRGELRDDGWQRRLSSR